MNKFFKSICGFGFAVLGLVIIYIQYVNPKRTGLYEISGIHKDVNISYDGYGIPHIFAMSESDAYAALGFAHAADRLFQMELLRRASQGRLAEIFGVKLLDADKYFRMLGIYQISKEQWSKADPNSYLAQISQAYVNGINQFIAEGHLPPEFMLLGFSPKPFTVLDSYSILNYMATTFGSGLKTDLMMTAIRNKVGAKMVSELDFAPTLKPSSLSSIPKIDISSKVLEKMAYIDDIMSSVGRFHGSNGWLIPSSRSESGFPILANDTHIEFSNPPTWFEAQISYPGFKLYGHFLAGCPFPLLGHTPDFAWGITIFPSDTMDVVADNKAKGRDDAIERSGQDIDLQKRKEVIDIKDHASQEFFVYSTDIGPIINDLFPDQVNNDTTLSLFSTLMDRNSDPMKMTYALSHAKDIKAFKEAASKIKSPSLNLLYAHKTEGIAWMGTGKLRSTRSDLSEYFVQRQEQFNPQFLSVDLHPEKSQPVGEIIANSNNQPEGSISFSGYYPYPARINRLKTLLSKKKKWSVEDLKAIQTDTKVTYWQPLKRILPDIYPFLNKEEQHYLDLMKNWDGFTHKDSKEPSLFYEWIGLAIAEMGNRHLGEKLGESYAKSYISLRSFIKLLNLPESKWWDHPKTQSIEHRNTMLATALKEAIRNLKIKHGEDMDNWSWGKDHTITLVHPFGRVFPLDLFFNLGPEEAHGGLDTINTYSFSLLPGHKKVRAGAATRRLIDMANPSDTLAILPGGQSGIIFDRHFSDQWTPYLQHQYRPARILKYPNESQLLLKPKPIPG